MKLTKNGTCIIAHCIILCMLFTQLFPILSYAENSTTTLYVGGKSISLSIQPYGNNLGIMMNAGEITEAFGMSYQLDEENKTFTIFDKKHGEIVLMHNATKFYSGDRLYNCKPYFYIENTIPMIELGFFCDMFESSYQYDEVNNTIYVDREKINDTIPKIKVGNNLFSAMLTPFVEEYGLVAGAEDIAYACGLTYTYDETNQTATFYDDKHGNVILTNGATSFKSGENEFECLPYFYLWNGIPIITVDFFCRMYGLEYQYDKDTKTLELFDLKKNAAKNAAKLLSTPTISGNITYAPGAPADTIPVKIVLQPFMFDMYRNIIRGSKVELGTITFQEGTTVKSYSYEIPSDYPYYYLYYEAPTVGKYGYYSIDEETVQRTTAPKIEDTTIAKRFSTNESAQANLTIDYNKVYGDITIGEKLPEDGLDVKIILKQGEARNIKYGNAYIIPGETYTLGTVHFNSSETKKQYDFITTQYYSEQYSYYSLFFEAPAISKYGYYNNVSKTTVLDAVPNYNDASWYADAPTEVIPLNSKRKLNLNIKSTINLNGTLSVDKAAIIPPTGLNVSLYLQSVKEGKNIYKGELISTYLYTDKTYELETFHLTNENPTLTFAYDTYQWTTAPYYNLVYRVKNSQDSVIPSGFVNIYGSISESQNYYETPMYFSVNKTSNVNIKLPAFVHKPCGTDNYWTLDTETGTLYIKGTGSVTDASWKLLSSYITTVKVSPGITSISSPMPTNIKVIYLPNTLEQIEKYSLSNCSKLEDVIFLGTEEEWSTISAEGINDWLTSANISFVDSDNVSVIYYNNGGSGSPESIEVKKNSIVTISSVAPVREGFEFIGWATTPTATTPQYKPGDTVTVGNSHLQLYALWDGDMVSSGSCGDNLTWSYYNGGILEINGTGDMYDYNNSNDVPWSSLSSDITAVYISNGITRIGVFAFFNCNNLTSITIPDSVTSIGDHTFGPGLTDIKIPANVNNISNSFSFCRNLTTITVADNNMYYSSDENGILFNKDKTTIIKYPIGKAQTTYAIPKGVISIDNFAFDECDKLTNITIPDSVTSIGNYSFSDCRSLTNIRITDNIKEIGYGAFRKCDKLLDIEISGNSKYFSVDERGVLFNKDKTILMQYPGGKPHSSYTVPESVTSIGNSAFSGCNSLTSITIPDSVTSIGDSAFSYCDNLTSIIIPDSITIIGNSAFSYCDNLTSIIIPDSVTSIDDYAFLGCDNLVSIYYRGTEESWNKLSIGSYNTPLTDSQIYFVPDGNIVIIYNDNGGVNGPSDLIVTANSESVTLSDIMPEREGFEFVGWATTEDATKATYQPGDTISVGEDAIILYTVWKASGSCGDNLTWTLYNDGNLVISGTGMIYNSPPWYSLRSNIKSVTITDGVTSIGNWAFSSCINLTSIAIPDSVTSIGDDVFENCNGLKNIYYSGSKKDWNKIDIGYSNTWWINNILQFNSYIILTKTSCSYNTGALVADLEFDHVNKDSVAYLAIYNTDNRLVEIASTDITVGMSSAKITIPTNINYTGYSYKIMFWNPTNLYPYTKAISGTIQN